MLLSGLRHLSNNVEDEARKMPILNDILDHEVLGREYKKGLRDGLEEGQQKGELALLLRLIDKRFGAVPASVEKLLSGKSPAELVDLGVRLLDAKDLNDLLGQK